MVKQKKKTTITYLQIDQLELEAYQRPLKDGPRSVLKKSNPWSAGRCDPLCVAVDGGHYYVVDGQHRAELARRAGVQEVPCILHYGWSYAQRAEEFERRNRDKSSPSPVAIFISQREQGKPCAVAIDRALTARKLKITASSGPACVRCPDVLRRAYDRGLLEALLDVVTAWRKSTQSEHAIASKALRAVLAFLIEEPNANRDELARKLSRHDPEAFLVRATALAKTADITFEAAAVSRLRPIYSKKLRAA